MTDAELIARLRSNIFGTGTTMLAADRIEALTEQLAAARDDAKAAEDELEMQEQEACMMENDYIKLEKERDALEAKLAKTAKVALAYEDWVTDAYDLLEERREEFDPESPSDKAIMDLMDKAEAGIARATIAEIKGESHE